VRYLTGRARRSTSTSNPASPAPVVSVCDYSSLRLCCTQGVLRAPRLPCVPQEGPRAQYRTPNPVSCTAPCSHASWSRASSMHVCKNWSDRQCQRATCRPGVRGRGRRPRRRGAHCPCRSAPLPGEDGRRGRRSRAHQTRPSEDEEGRERAGGGGTPARCALAKATGERLYSVKVKGNIIAIRSHQNERSAAISPLAKKKFICRQL